jgi:hypothetical protein
MTRTQITLQDLIDRGLNPQGWQVTVDGSGNFILTAPSGGPGGGGIGIMAWDEGVPLQTGTIMNFVGDGVTATISGTVIDVDVAGGAASPPVTGSFVLYDETSLLGSVTTLIVQGDNIEAFVSGTFGYIYQTGSAGAPNKILLYDQDTETALEYDFGSGGFNQALAAAASGDVVWVPPGTIPGNFVVPNGVHVMGISRQSVIFNGRCNLGQLSTIEQLSIQRTANDGSSLIGVVNHDALGVSSQIINCYIQCEQNGTGSVRAISMEGNGDLEVWHSNLDAIGNGGLAHAAVHEITSGGNLYVYNSRAHGTTAPFLEET